MLSLLRNSRFKAIQFGLAFLLCFVLYSPFAHAYDAECVAEGISDYMRKVIERLPREYGTARSNIKLLTPTFNMSEGQFEELYRLFRNNPNTIAVRNRLTGTIGNAYNTSGKTVGYWVKRINNVGGPIGEMHLAETGRFNTPTDQNPIPVNLVDSVKAESGITLTSANLFNVFGTNRDPGFAHHILSDDEIRQVCGGDCGKIGFNLGTGFNSSTYDRARNLGLGYVVGIVMGMNDVNSVVEAAEAGFKPIVRIGYGNCNGSMAGEFEDAEKYAEFIKRVASAIGTKTVYFIVGPNEPDAEQWWADKYGQKRNCGCVGSFEGSNPFGADEEPPACTSSSLKIKGVLKSSRSYTYDPMNPNRLVRVPPQDSKNPTPRDYPVITNQTINGAVIAIYRSKKEIPPADPLPPGQKMINHTGKYDGKISGLLKSVRTQKGGKFEVQTQVSSDCSEVWDGAKDGWKQYIAFFCPDIRPDGTKGLVLKDLYSIHLKPGVENAVMDFNDKNLDCDPYAVEHGLFSPPRDLEYVVKNKEQFLACSGIGAPAPEFTMNASWPGGDTPLEFHGEREKEGITSFFGNLLTRLLEVLAELLFGRDNLPFSGRTEGRMALQELREDYITNWGLVPGFFRGVKEGYLSLPRYFLNNPPAGVETYNGHEEVPPAFNCEMLRRSSMVMGEEGYEDFNLQTSGGTYNNLAPPFGGLVRGDDGKIDPYLSGDIARYLAANKNLSPDKTLSLLACTDDAGNKYYLEDFMPPEGFCGDIDENGKIDTPFEMPCPETYICGDLNGNGLKTDEGEIDCANVRVQNLNNPTTYGNDYRYKFDVRYFPYFLLDTLTTTHISTKLNVRAQDLNDDKIGVCGPGADGSDGRFLKDEGPEGNSRPENNPECHGGPEPVSYRFLLQALVKYPNTPTNVGIFKTLFTLSEKINFKFPHSMIMSFPVFVNASNSRELVLDSVKEAVSKVELKNVGEPIRIGILDQLCTCSYVENGAHGDPNLGDCLHDAQNPHDRAPDPRKPLNTFDSTMDYKLPDERGKYIFGTDTDPNVLKVAASYDWTNISKSSVTFNYRTGTSIFDYSYGEKPKDEEDHYKQKVTANIIDSFNSAKHFLTNVVNCLKGEEESQAPDPNKSGDKGYKKAPIGCGEVVHALGKPSVWVPQMLKADFTRNWYPFATILLTPFTTLMVEDAGAESDTSYTKAQNLSPSLGNDTRHGKGKEISRGTASSLLNSYDNLVNAVKDPVFDGEYSGCRIVSGWHEEKIGDKGLFATVCGSGKCWVGGAVKDEGWTGKEYISSSTDFGNSWSANELGNADLFIHGLDYYAGRPFAAGQDGRVLNFINNSWQQASRLQLRKPRPNTDSLFYTGFLYDIGGGPKGYIATGTGHVFYSPDGVNNWMVISKTDAQTGLTGCESTDWPYGCVGYDSNNPGACDAIPNNAVPDCCCVGYSPISGVDADGISQTPNCPNGVRGTPGECWLWGSSSIWGVDCDETSGDCVIAGQTSPESWYGNASGAGGLGNADNWRRYSLPVSGHAMDAAFAGSSSLIYLVGGASNGGDEGGGFILMSQNKGARWDNVTPAGIDSGFKGIDCFDAENCAVVGSKGQVVVLRDGRWQSWESLWPGDPAIQEAKSSGVRFWDVAYPSRDKIIAVGFKPKSPGSPDVDGVIYTLGQREICEEEAPIISCPSPSGASSCPFNDGGMLFWDNNNTTSCLPTQVIKDPAQIPGATSLVPVYGTIKFRDPVTYGSQNYILNSCNLAPTPRTCNAFINGVPMITVDYGGQRYIFKLDKDLYNSCPRISDLVNIGEINYRILVPAGSKVALRVGDQVCGETNPCTSDTVIKGVNNGVNVEIEDWFDVNRGLCANAIVWSQVRPVSENGVPVNYTNQCGYTERCKQDYCDNVGLQYSGNCVAQRKGYPVGFKPCQ